MYITPFMTARMSVRRLPPPGFAAGINGFTYAHSSSVRSLGYRRWSRLYFGRFLCVHIGGPSRIRPPPLNPKDSIDSRSFETDTQCFGRRVVPLMAERSFAGPLPE